MEPTPSRRAVTAGLAFVALAAFVFVAALGAGTAVGLTTGVVNPSFEGDWSSGTPDCWQMGSVGSGSATLSANSAAHSGSRSVKLTVSRLSSKASREIVMDQQNAACAAPVVEGHTYLLSAYYSASTAVRLRIYYRDATGWHYWARGVSFAARSSWGKLAFTTAAVPVGATALSFGPAVTKTGWVLLDDAAMTDTTPTPTVPSTSLWRPAVGASWQIQLSGVLDLSVPASVFVVDGFDTSASQVEALHASGRRAVCYLSAGSWEDWRPDAASYPASVLGASNGWPGERWLDIRQIEVLKPILDRRLQMCRDKGFDAVDPDNVDGYANRSGFALTAADQVAFNRWLAAEVHTFGMSVGLKNDLDQVPELVDAFDFAVNEQCYEYAECAALAPFPAAGKAVLQIEYSTDPAIYCPDSRARGMSSVKKHLDLGVYRQPC